ncbi:MAG: hypothetical protein ACJAYU_004636 [Bradymonadia bacterium]
MVAAACSDSGQTYFINPDAVQIGDTSSETGLQDTGDDADTNSETEDVEPTDTPLTDTELTDTEPTDTQPTDTEPTDTLPTDAGEDADRDADPTDTNEPDAAPDVDEPDADPDTEPDVDEPDAEPDTPASRACGDDWFSGQAYESPDAPVWSAEGGFRIEAPYPRSYDSGIDSAIASAPFDSDPTDDESPFPVAISTSVVQTTVFATAPNTLAFSGAQRSFWIHDGVASVQIFLDEFGDDWPTFAIQVGQHISFTATEVSSYRGVPQISGATDWSLESAGNAVAFRSVDEAPIRFEDVPDNVRLTGTIVADLGPCGGTSNCFELAYGTQSVAFRTSLDRVQAGDCIAWAGPVGTFGGLPQLDGSNFNWFFDYGPAE